MTLVSPPEARTGVRLHRRLLEQVGRASRAFSMVEAGDRILCGLSGGKDSYVMIWMLREIQRRVPFDVELIGVNLDQGHPGFPQHVIADWCEAEGFAHHMMRRDTYSVVLDKIPEGKTYCSLCSRLRRGILYEAAADLGCTKIALGHHRDDLLETLMLNLMYSGRLKAMAPRLTSDDGRNVVIRPLAYCDEADVARYAAEHAFPIVPCNLCGSQDNLQRQQIKAMLADWSARNPKIKGNMFAAMGNVCVSHLLDRDLMDRVGGGAPTGDDPTVP